MYRYRQDVKKTSCVMLAGITCYVVRSIGCLYRRRMYWIFSRGGLCVRLDEKLATN